jgi:hypothetical protein
MSYCTGFYVVAVHCSANMRHTINKHVDMIKIILLLAALLPCPGKTIRPVKSAKLMLLRYVGQNMLDLYALQATIY